MKTPDDDDALRERIARADTTRVARGLPLAATITAPESPSAPPDPASLPRIALVETPDLEIVGVLGEGGMGRVHLARQHSLSREVAVKTLKADASAAVRKALLREARITGSLEHPGVIPVHALGADEAGRPTLVMKRVSGTDLATQLGGKPCSGEQLMTTIDVLVQVCRTLEFAHSRGVIHRDVKPDNIMVGAFGEVYVLDWGIATTTEDAGRGPLVGTPVYMAPEMARGDRVDARTDVYLLGATLHEILTGRPLHDGTTMIDVMRSAIRSAPVTYGPEVPEELARLANRATARDPAERPANVRILREALSAFVRHESARQLARAAIERLSELEALLAAGDGPPPDLAHAYRLLTEARFGLTQSLREHDQASAAREAMQRCLLAGIDLELRQDHVDSADALARELAATQPSVTARIAERRAALAARARDQERLALLARDLDPTERASARTLPILAVAALLAVVGGIAAVRAPYTSIETTLVGGAVGLGMIVGLVLAVRRGVLTNAFNRRLAAVFALALGCGVLNRIIGLVAGTPAEVSLTTDLFVGAAILFVTSITLLRRFWVCALVLLAGHGVARAWPDRVPLVYAVTILVAAIGGAAVLGSTRRE